MVTPPAASARHGRARKIRSARRRTEILDAAVEVFATSGYRAGSLRTVATRVGISEAGLLHHFPSKAALLAGVLERRDDDVRAELEEPRSVAGLLDMLIDRARRDAATPWVVELFCTLSAEATSRAHPAHEWFVSRYAEIRARLVRVFSVAEAESLLAPGVSPEGAARSTVALWDGLQVQWLLDRDAVDVPRELRDHLRRLTTLPL
jgi:AcrR family transcriptional regulator